MPRAQTISVPDLCDLLARIDHATPVGFIALTAADARVTGNPYGKGGIRKLCRFNGIIGADHEAAVQRQQAREGQEPTYEVVERSWGRRIAPALVEHRGAFYMPVQLNPVVKPRPLYLVPKLRGSRTILTAVPKEVVAAYLAPERDQRAHQMVAREVTRRDFRLDHLPQITLNGKHYRIRP